MTKIISREEYDSKRNNKCAWKDDCPYYNINTELNTVVFESNYWKMFIALSNYTWDEYHLLAFPKNHKVFHKELSDDEILDLKNIHNFCDEYFENKEYFSMTRESMSNRSIEHYHIHFVEWIMKAATIVEMLNKQK
jgi:diadenosine tetraphosphate (Ap4A) HIT family hydrolase